MSWWHRRELNPLRSALQADALPVSYGAISYSQAELVDTADRSENDQSVHGCLFRSS